MQAPLIFIAVAVIFGERCEAVSSRRRWGEIRLLVSIEVTTDMCNGHIATAEVTPV
jgi:hypothetical protein